MFKKALACVAAFAFGCAVCAPALAAPLVSQEILPEEGAAPVEYAQPLSGAVLEQDAPVLALARGLLDDMAATAPIARMSLEANVANIAGMREEGYYEAAMAGFDALAWGADGLRALVLPLGYEELLAYIEFSNPGIEPENARAVADVQAPMLAADPTFFAAQLFNVTAFHFDDDMLAMATVTAISSIQGEHRFSAPAESWTDRAVLLFLGEEGAEEALVVCSFAPAGVGSAGLARAAWLPAETAAWVQKNLDWWLEQGTWYGPAELDEACGAWKPNRFMMPTRLTEDVDAYLLGIARERGTAIGVTLNDMSIDFLGLGYFMTRSELLEIPVVAGVPENSSFFTLPAAQGVLDAIAACYPEEGLSPEEWDALAALYAANPAGVYDALVVDGLWNAGWYGGSPEGYAVRQEATMAVDGCMQMAQMPGTYKLPEGWTQDVVLVEISTESSFALVTVFAQAPGRVLDVETYVVRLNRYGDGWTAGEFLRSLGCTDGTPYGSAA